MKTWVIGVDEEVGVIYNLSKVLTPSISVVFKKDSLYSHDYTHVIQMRNLYLSYILRIFIGPIFLGYLLNKYRNYIYIWETGFLLNRDFEFKLQKENDNNIVCLFIGSDIRSPLLLKKFLNSKKLDGFLDYLATQRKNLFSTDYELNKRELAESADRYADLVFSAPIDQFSYLNKKQHFYPYPFDDKKFIRNPNKFLCMDTIKIVHAPSNPLIKGTPLVRAAITALEREGYHFDYIELTNVPNSQVLSHLESAHIVLNQFYTFLPGFFGIEAMAKNCAVLMSADSNIEASLKNGIPDPWLVTSYCEIYENLKYLLDNTDRIKYYADNGFEYALSKYSYTAAAKEIQLILDGNIRTEEVEK